MVCQIGLCWIEKNTQIVVMRILDKNEILVKCILLLGIFLSIAGYLLLGLDKQMVYVLLVVNVLVIYYTRNMQAAMLIFIFILTYNIHYLYNWQGVQLSPYVQFQKMEYYGISSMLSLLLFAGVIIAMKLNGNKERKRSTFSYLKDKERSKLWFGVCCMVCVLILLYLQRQGTNLLLAGGDLYNVYRDILESISGLAVYFYIFFFLLFVYRPDALYNIAIGVILIWYLWFAMTRGMRMLMVPPMLICFFYFFENKFRSVWIVVFAALGVFLLSAINRFKNNLPIWGSAEKSDILINNQSELLYGSNAVIGTVQEMMINFVDRMELFGGYVITCLLPPSVLPDSLKFPHYLSGLHVEFGGGGLIVSSFYVMLGVLGPVLLGVYLGYIINYVYEKKNPNYYLSLFFVLSFFLVTRWYSYDANLLFRLSFYTLFVIGVFKLVEKVCYGKKKSIDC